jgi:hypothetical protein
VSPAISAIYKELDGSIEKANYLKYIEMKNSDPTFEPIFRKAFQEVFL